MFVVTTALGKEGVRLIQETRLVTTGQDGAFTTKIQMQIFELLGGSLRVVLLALRYFRLSHPEAVPFLALYMKMLAV